ncbi:hypothetical protein NL676_038739 [Syzygium grande]|nr:hypothetical protein NL676_038739 [Syzygium grande]
MATAMIHFCSSSLHPRPPKLELTASMSAQSSSLLQWTLDSSNIATRSVVDIGEVVQGGTGDGRCWERAMTNGEGVRVRAFHGQMTKSEMPDPGLVGIGLSWAHGP